MESVTKQSVIDRIKPLFEQAVKNRTGVSYLLSEAEHRVFTDADLAQIKVETGYSAMMSTQPKVPQVFFDEIGSYLNPAPIQAAVGHALDSAVTLPQDADFDSVRDALAQGKAVRFDQ